MQIEGLGLCQPLKNSRKHHFYALGIPTPLPHYGEITPNNHAMALISLPHSYILEPVWPAIFFIQPALSVSKASGFATFAFW